MGIGSYDVTGDGYPEVYLTSQGAERAPDAARRPVEADLPRHLDRPRGHRHPTIDGWRSTAVDRVAPGVRGRQQRWLRRPVRLEGQRRRPARLRDQGPVRPVPRPARTARSARSPKPPGSSTSRAGEARRSSTSTSTGCSTSSRSIDGAPVRIWRNMGSGGAAGPVPMGHWLGVRPAEPGPNRDAIGAWLDIAGRRQDRSIGS